MDSAEPTVTFLSKADLIEQIKIETQRLLGLALKIKGDVHACVIIKQGKTAIYCYVSDKGLESYVWFDGREVFHDYSRNDEDNRMDVFYKTVEYFKEYCQK